MSKPNYIEGIERRYFQSKVEKRAGEGSSEFDFGGLASRTGVEYIMYEDDTEKWVEEIATGAFDDVIGQDIRCLFNHDSNLILGRTQSNTARVGVTNEGLGYEWKNDDEISYAKDLARSIERGDVNQSSFGFFTDYSNNTFLRTKLEDGRMLYKRTINKIDVVYDVSPVTFPASPSTDVGKRNFQEAKATFKKHFEDEEQRNQSTEQQTGRNLFEIDLEIKEKVMSL